MDETADRSPFRRFPYGPALLCAACLAMCAWMWMRYSYAWDVTPADIAQAKLPEAYQHGEWPYGRRYIRLEGVLRVYDPGSGGDFSFEWADLVLSNGQPMDIALVKRGIPDDERKRRVPGRLSMIVELRRGNVGVSRHLPWFEVGSARLTGESVSGLVVGAMGVFVFGLYLGSYLRGRRAGSTTEHTEHTRAAEGGA